MLRVESELRGGHLGIHPSSARVYHHRAYHSPARKTDIIVDVSIELFRPGADQPYLVWIWECKDYRHAIPVDDVEEFHAKLTQIGPSRTKGTIASRSGFQASAIEVARTWGIGLVHMQSDGSLTRLLESAVREDTAAFVFEGLVQAPGTALRSDFFGLTSDGAPAITFGDYIEAECQHLEPA
jgi:hypothetical protein